MILGAQLGERAEGQHVVAVDLTLVALRMAHLVPTRTSRLRFVYPVVEDSEVFDPLGLAPDE